PFAPRGPVVAVVVVVVWASAVLTAAKRLSAPNPAAASAAPLITNCRRGIDCIGRSFLTRERALPPVRRAQRAPRRAVNTRRGAEKFQPRPTRAAAGPVWCARGSQGI